MMEFKIVKFSWSKRIPTRMRTLFMCIIPIYSSIRNVYSKH